MQLRIGSEADLENADAQKEKWHKFNLDYLRHCFDSNSIAEEYDSSADTSLYINPSFDQQIESFINALQSSIHELESIVERLSLFQEVLSVNSTHVQQSIPDSAKIFIVHGHDEALKNKVARFVNKMNLEEIILDEQPNAGMTVIEK